MSKEFLKGSDPFSKGSDPGSAADRAYAFAKERILDGRFAGGEMISEGEVAKPTGLSRTPVREAFLRLEAEGFLRLYPKRGALIVPVSPTEVGSVMETRRVVERFAVEKVIETGAAVEDDLRRLIERQEELVAAGDSQGFVDADREFHRVLVAAAANPILLEWHDSLRDRQSRMGREAIAREDDRIPTIMREHRELADAIAAGDATAATAVLERHLAGTLRALLGQPGGG